jgi:serine phosphatase RsbU (regulator of sigma subunit)
MGLRAKLILSFWGLAVVPLAAITLYSYRSSLGALHAVAEQESSAMASDMGSRMESVSKDINRQIEMIATSFEFRRVMALDKKDRPAAMEALRSRLKSQMGENVSSLRFTPAGASPSFPLPHPGMQQSNGTIPKDMSKEIIIDLSGDGPGPGSPENGGRPPLMPFPRDRFDAELRNGNELVGKVSAEIKSRHLLHQVLMRTQPRQGEIPFAMDEKGKLYATNATDLDKVKNLSVPKAGAKNSAEQQVARAKDWVIVTRKDAHSGLTFGIARPISDRLGDLRNNSARNMGYGLLIVALAMIGVIPLSSKMTRNLTTLTRETENLAKGNFNARVKVTSKDEIGKLSQAFNRMAADISENQKHLIEREKLQKELEMCRKIQEELLPRQPFRSGAVEVKGVSIPAQEVGGDFFDYFSMADGKMALIIGDVSGKGLPAALLMANLQARIQARLPVELDMVKLAEQLDGEIVVNDEAYLTLFMAILDSQSLRLRYVNAGHNPQLLLRKEGSIEQLQSTGRPLGLMAGGGFQEESVLLKNGDSLFFYTDGLVEAENESGVEFGMTRLEALLVKERPRGLEGMLAKVEETVGKYRGRIEAADDATMMLLKIV